MHDYIEAHPEIKFVSLVWLWDFWAIYQSGDCIFEEVGEEFDWEYTVVAPRDLALKHLDNYDNWDCYVTPVLDQYISNGKLAIVHHAESEYSGGKSLYQESRIREDDNGILSLANVSCAVLRHIDEPITNEEKCFTRKWNN